MAAAWSVLRLVPGAAARANAAQAEHRLAHRASDALRLLQLDDGASDLALSLVLAAPVSGASVAW